MKSESRSHLYLKAGFFLLPALLLLQAVNFFIIPKLMALQADYGLANAQLNGLVDVPYFLSRNGYSVFIALTFALVLLELRVRAWERYRKAVVNSLVFLINTTVLVNLTSIIIAALIMVPTLAGR